MFKYRHLILFSDYASLMTPAPSSSGRRGSSSSSSSGTLSASGRFHFRRKTLTYAFVSSPDFGRPKLVTFLDGDGNTVEEFPVQESEFQVREGKEMSVKDLIKLEEKQEESRK